MRYHLLILTVGVIALVPQTESQISEEYPNPPPYPTYNEVPKTNFDCKHRWGFYADPETGCQVFHLCQWSSKIAASFLCTNGTLFQQNHSQRCDYWYKVKCPTF
ncbi:uncharacterized protein LOC106460940 [Limulus polyphemus]|uniref:Uncharacterized protein LOC106460940 n=1 Tax=Limulus polyphemus TaxID=6850 RepID=A0ABM1B741_LIMPO|nr:uncharacterized protein LOC106460940 [Limulus polyphemus]